MQVWLFQSYSFEIFWFNGVKYKYIFESQCVVRFKNDCSLGLTF